MQNVGYNCSSVQNNNNNNNNNNKNRAIFCASGECGSTDYDEYYIDHDYLDHGYTMIGYLDIDTKDNVCSSISATTPVKASASSAASTTLPL